MTKHYLYTLAFDAAPEPVVFYVGHTNDPARRETEHRGAAKNPKNTEYKYQWCRELAALGIGWNFIVIGEIEDDEDSEYEWILKFARKNKELGITFFDDLPLTNMKAGDFLTEIIDDRSINTRDEIKLYRQIYELSKTAVTYEREGVEPTAQAQAVIDETLEQAAVSRQAAAIALVKQQERDRAYEAMINDPKRIARIKAETEQLMLDAGEMK